MAGDHGFHPIRIRRVIEETSDTRTYVLDTEFPYRAGQFVTIRACGTLRSYSMSSSPETDAEFMTTVKRVPGGLVSNWMHDHLAAGDLIETTRPAGVFCLRETTAPLLAFCGGSGITPILSLVKTALTTTSRRVRVLTADRDADSVIFAAALAELSQRYPGRFELRRHLDSASGYVTAAEVRDLVAADTDADVYLCGPTPFMDLVEFALLEHGVSAGQILVERFNPAAEPSTNGSAADATSGGTVEIVLAGKRHTVAQHVGETLLESARRAGLTPPFSCEAGNCATCIAQITKGKATMRVNNALEADEIADGWVLTCQGEPATDHVTVVYDD